jgi:hypothetical protein
MKTEQIKFDLPKGFVVDKFDTATATLHIKEAPKKVTDRIKTVSDLLADHGFTQGEFDAQCKGLSQDEIAYRLLKLLAFTLNEGWEPNWDNSNEGKYFPWFYFDGGSSGFRFSASATVGLRFRSSALALLLKPAPWLSMPRRTSSMCTKTS